MTEQTRPTDGPATEPTDEQLRSWGYDGPNGRAQYKRDEAAQGAAPLDPLLPDSAVAEMLRKVIRQYHGNGHREGSWTHCDNRWCRDAQAVLEGAAPRVEGLDVERLRLAIAACVAQHGRQWRQTFDIIWPNSEDVLPSEAAELIAAEYARLSRPSNERVTESEASHE